jgi:hypothetical protein
VKEGGNILAQTALRPLGLKKSGVRGDHYVTIHPAQVRQPAGTLDLFARIRQGDRVCLMKGTTAGLLGALPSLVSRALEDGQLDPSSVRAALLIYCAGCAGAVGDKLGPALQEHLGHALPSAAWLGFCTFGEQGHVPGVGNVHQDLSLSLLLVG